MVFLFYLDIIEVALQVIFDKVHLLQLLGIFVLFYVLFLNLAIPYIYLWTRHNIYKYQKTNGKKYVTRYVEKQILQLYNLAV